MPTRIDFVNDIKANLPQAYSSVGKNDQTGKNYYDLWANNQIASSEKDREFAIYQAEGLSQHLKNVITNYLNLPSVGYNDFSDKKKVQGDQYRGYIATAKAVYDSSIAQLSDMQASNAHAAAIALQEKVIKAQFDNWQAWIKTYQDSIAKGWIQ